MIDSQKTTVAEVDLECLRGNYHAIRRHVAPADVMAVVKANAYGHGAVPVARCLQVEGARHFAVARVAEGLELQQAGITGKILIFGTLFPDELETAIAHGLQVTATRAEDFAMAARLAAARRTTAIVHVKVDTGMGRVGLPCDSAVETIRSASGLPDLRIEGVYTHFATADCREKSFAEEQLARFTSLIGGLQRAGVSVPLVHAANSGAILDLPATCFDLVRPGIALYGHYPTTETSESVPLRQVMTFKTRVAQVRALPAGTSVSYGRRYVTQSATRIAVLNVGYADGVSRAFTNKGLVLIRGRLFPMVGTITMDQLMVDIGTAPVGVGDDVVLWGQSNQGALAATQVAERVGTIPYELCCAVAPRVPRRYLNEED